MASSINPSALQSKAPKRQTVDHLFKLRVDDPTIDRDAQLLEMIRQSYRFNCVRRGYRRGLKTRPALYVRYRGPRFPVEQRNGKQAPRWRSLSPWMKIQIGTMALSERGYMLFKVHLHDELSAELRAKGISEKDYLRDRLTRCARKTFREGRWFFFVMEDLTAGGEATRPHAHGSMEVRPWPLPAKGKQGHLTFRRLAEREGLEHAERIYGLLKTKEVLRAASGNVRDVRPRLYLGLDQARNVWTSTPKRPFLNLQYVTYAFKNSQAFSASLGENRLAFSQSLRTEARKLWQLIRLGESALSQWP